MAKREKSLFCPICGLKLKAKYFGNANRECKNGHKFKFAYRGGLLIMIQCKDVLDPLWA